MLLELRAAQLACIFVYLHEAHADDIWPLGYGIYSHQSLQERWVARDAMFAKHPCFHTALDTVVVDGMADEFLHRSGAWPERYFFVDK